MGSMVSAAGAPRRWRRIREEWHRRLPLPCGQCGEPVSPGEPWSLGHMLPRAAGGGDEAGNLWPEHRRCSDRSGARLGGLRAAERRGGARTLPPSREW